MAVFFVILLMLTPIALVVGLIKPHLFLRLTAGSNSPRKRLSIFFGVLAIILFVLIGLTGESPNKVASDAETQNEESPVASPAQNELVEEKYKVTKVVDGDTIQVEGGKTIRYIGIDTPETSDPSKPVECYSKEATQKNRELVEGKEIRVEKDVSETDQYQRLLRYVFVGDVFVNEVLVKDGFAKATAYPPDTKKQDVFSKAQEDAKSNKSGLWGKCSTASPSPATGTSKVSPSPKPTATQKQPTTGTSTYTGGDKDCGDFSTHAEAQSFFVAQGGPSSDPHKLDQDHDGVACETLP
ncbi:MAG: thermonuclease family protein [Candidatus Curtissbacteria bacterium]|nr:thermonuclease family protein [Candidatus Curtissbacteria bacterium]